MKKILAVIFCFVLSLCLVFMPAFNIKGVDITGNSDQKKVLTIYHADVKSGGKNSRGSFLKSVAKEYGKKENVLVIVEIYDKSELENAIKSGKPDIISFGSGLFSDANLFSPYRGRVNFFDEFFQAVEVDDVIYAVPWAYNGYFLIGSGDKTNALKDNSYLAAYLSEKALTLEGTLDSEVIYNEYLLKKTSFVGTAKEVSKLMSRVERGKLDEFSCEVLCGFTDMINVLGIYSESENNAEAQTFIEYVTSESVQRKLSYLNLFSPCVKGIYSVSPFSEYEKEKVVPLSVFDCENYCELAKLALSGDKNAQKEIEKILNE